MHQQENDVMCLSYSVSKIEWACNPIAPMATKLWEELLYCCSSGVDIYFNIQGKSDVENMSFSCYNRK